MIWSIYLSTLLLPSLVYSDGGTFYHPPNAGTNNTFSDNAAYKIGDMLQIRWLTDISNISLVLWQNGNDADFEYLLPDVQNPNNYNWIIQTDKDLNDSSSAFPYIFSMAVYEYGSTSFAFNSRPFNLTPPDTSASPPSISTTTSATFSPTISLSNQPTAITSSTLTSSTTPTAPAASPPGGLSPSTNAGLGLGLGAGVGIPLLVAIGALTGSRLVAKRRNRSASSATKPMLCLEAPPRPQLQIGYYDGPRETDHAYAVHTPSSELPDVQSARLELPSSGKRVPELPDRAADR